MEDSPYIPNIDTTLLAIKNRIGRFNHRCPYNNKRLTRRTENTLNQAEVMQDTIKQRMEKETDEEKSKQYAKILRELAVRQHYYLVARSTQEVLPWIVQSFHQHTRFESENRLDLGSTCEIDRVEVSHCDMKLILAAIHQFEQGITRIQH